MGVYSGGDRRERKARRKPSRSRRRRWRCAAISRRSSISATCATGAGSCQWLAQPVARRELRARTLACPGKPAVLISARTAPDALSVAIGIVRPESTPDRKSTRRDAPEAVRDVRVGCGRSTGRASATAWLGTCSPPAAAAGVAPDCPFREDTSDVFVQLRIEQSNPCVMIAACGQTSGLHRGCGYGRARGPAVGA